MSILLALSVALLFNVFPNPQFATADPTVVSHLEDPCMHSIHQADQARMAYDPKGGRMGLSEPADCVFGFEHLNDQAQRPLDTSDPLSPIYWFSFGDSYTETGFNASGTLPSIGNPLGNPPYPGWTGTGENPNWVDYLTTTHNRSLILTYNFALGGATINSSLVPPGQRVSLEDEVNTFLNKFAHKPPSTPWQTETTLFSVWIGINDIGYTYHHGGDRAAFSDQLLDSYFTLVDKLYKAGARLFLFINVPPVHRTPAMLRRHESEQVTERAVIEGYNSKLQTRIDWFEGNHSDVMVWRWDSHGAINSILDDPTSHGFRDATSYGDHPSHFWGNSYHPGSSAHNIFAHTVNDLLGDTFF